MIFPLILLLLSLAGVIALLFSFIKGKSLVYKIIVGVSSALFAASCVLGVRFALSVFTESNPAYVVTAALFLYFALGSLFAFIAIPKSIRFIPQILVASVLVCGIIFLGFAFHYGRVSLDNETRTSVSSALMAIKSILFR